MTVKWKHLLSSYGIFNFKASGSHNDVLYLPASLSTIVTVAVSCVPISAQLAPQLATFESVTVNVSFPSTSVSSNRVIVSLTQLAALPAIEAIVTSIMNESKSALLVAAWVILSTAMKHEKIIIYRCIRDWTKSLFTYQVTTFQKLHHFILTQLRRQGIALAFTHCNVNESSILLHCVYYGIKEVFWKRQEETYKITFLKVHRNRFNVKQVLIKWQSNGNIC